MFDITEAGHVSIAVNAEKMIQLQQKLDFLQHLKKVFEEPAVKEHHDSLKAIGKIYGINTKRTFQNYAYEVGTKESQALIQLYHELHSAEVDTEVEKFNLLRNLLALRTIPAICKNFLVLINTQIEIYQHDLRQLTSVEEEEESKSVDAIPVRKPTTDANESTHLLGDKESKETIPSTCCSATLKTSLAATSLITLGSALTAASTLVYLNNPSIAFLIALHAPQAVVIAAAVVGALMVAYGLYLVIRMVCAARGTQQSEEKTSVADETAALKAPSYSSLFDRMNDAPSASNVEEDVEPLEIETNGCSMTRFFSCVV